MKTVHFGNCAFPSIIEKGGGIYIWCH